MAKRRALGRALTGFAENFLPAWQSMQYMDHLQSREERDKARDEREARTAWLDESERVVNRMRQTAATPEEMEGELSSLVAAFPDIDPDTLRQSLAPGLLNRGERIQGVIQNLGQLAPFAPPSLVGSVAEQMGLTERDRLDSLPSLQVTGTAPLAGPVVSQVVPGPRGPGIPFGRGDLRVPPDLLEGTAAKDVASVQADPAFTPLDTQVAPTVHGWGPQWEVTQSALQEGERARQEMLGEFATAEQVRERSTQEMLDNKYLQDKIDRELAETEADPTRFDAFENWKKQQEWTIENWSMQTGLQAERAAIMENATVPGRLAFYEGQLDLAYESDQRRAEFDVAQRALVEAAALNERLQDDITRATGLEFETLQRAQDLRDSRAAGIQLNYQQQGELDRVTGKLGKARILHSVAEREGVLDAETRELIKRAQGPLSDAEFKQYKRRQVLNTVLNAPAETFAIQYGADGNPSESLMLSRDKNTGEWRYDSMGAFHPELHDDYVSGGPYADIIGSAFQAMTSGEVGPVSPPAAGPPVSEDPVDAATVGGLETYNIPGRGEVTGPAGGYIRRDRVYPPTPVREVSPSERWGFGDEDYTGPQGVTTEMTPEGPVFYRRSEEGLLGGAFRIPVPISHEDLLAKELDPFERSLAQTTAALRQANDELEKFTPPEGRWATGDAQIQSERLRAFIADLEMEAQKNIKRQAQIMDWFRVKPPPQDRDPGKGGFVIGNPIEQGRPD